MSDSLILFFAIKTHLKSNKIRWIQYFWRNTSQLLSIWPAAVSSYSRSAGSAPPTSGLTCWTLSWWRKSWRQAGEGLCHSLVWHWPACPCWVPVVFFRRESFKLLSFCLDGTQEKRQDNPDCRRSGKTLIWMSLKWYIENRDSSQVCV